MTDSRTDSVADKDHEDRERRLTEPNSRPSGPAAGEGSAPASGRLLTTARARVVVALRSVPARLASTLCGPRGPGVRRPARVLLEVAEDLLDATSETLDPWATRLAVKALREAAQLGEPAAAHRLAMLYFCGNRVPRDLDTACIWFARASVAGDGEAAFRLGLINEFEYDPPRGRAAMAWYKVAMQQGHRSAACALGLLLDQGHLVARDVALAERAYRSAASGGDVSAQHFLAGLYYRERGLDPDYRRSFGWYVVAAAGGHGQAASNAAVMLRMGRGSPRNLHWARRLAEQAVEQGVEKADHVLDAVLSDILETQASDPATGDDPLSPTTIH